MPIPEPNETAIVPITTKRILIMILGSNTSISCAVTLVNIRVKIGADDKIGATVTTGAMLRAQNRNSWALAAKIPATM